MPIQAMTKEKLEKLPKWVQLHIQTQSRKIEMMEETLAALNGDKITDVYFDFAGKRYYLPERTTVYMNITPRLKAQFELRKREPGRCIHVFTSDQAIILPESTNHFVLVSARKMSIVFED